MLFINGPFANGASDVWVVMEATRGDGSMGDIAIDDVDLYQGRCMYPSKLASQSDIAIDDVDLYHDRCIYPSKLASQSAPSDAR